MKKLSFILFAFILAVSCSNETKVPKDILPKEKMLVVMWDVISAGEYLEAFVMNKDSADKNAARSKVYDQVFRLNNITKAEFDKSYQYYRQHPELMKIILDSLGKKQLYTTEKFREQADSTQIKIPDKETAY